MIPAYLKKLRTFWTNVRMEWDISDKGWIQSTDSCAKRLKTFLGIWVFTHRVLFIQKQRLNCHSIFLYSIKGAQSPEPSGTGVTWFANLFGNRKLKKRIMVGFGLFLGKLEQITNSKSELASELCYTECDASLIFRGYRTLNNDHEKLFLEDIVHPIMISWIRKHTLI